MDGTPTIECGAETPQSPCQATLTAPRFDDLLNAFGPAERAGVKLILLELSRALDERGDDVNAAALELRPAMVAANEALAEVNSQNAALRAVIEDAEDVTGQAAAKRAELGGLIDSLETTLVATAEESGSLDAGLERLPETTAQARSTMSALARRRRGRDAAGARGRGERSLSLRPRSTRRPGSSTTPRSRSTTPSPRSTSRAASCKAGEPTIEADPTRVVTGAFDLAPAISNLLTGVLGDENTIKALFGDDGEGHRRGHARPVRPRRGLERARKPDLLSRDEREPQHVPDLGGLQLHDVRRAGRARVPARHPHAATSTRTREAERRLGRTAGEGQGSRGDGGSAGDDVRRRLPGHAARDPRDPLGLGDVLDDTLPNLPDLGGGSGDKDPKGPKGADQAAQDLLDFLFKP